MGDKFAIYGSDVSQSKDGIANGIRETAGPTNLAAGEIVDGEYLLRSGNKIISSAVVAAASPATQIIETSGPTTLTIAAIVDGEFLKRVGSTVVSAASGALTPGAANTVFVTNGAGTAVITALLVNANVDPAAAIAGTKIAPNFGAQNIVTTGTLSVLSATITSFGTGIVHSDGSGILASSLIVNADINAAAAIAGTKINPAFGAQAISTSSTLNVGAATTTALTVSTLGTGIVHSSVAGVFSSSLIVAADVTTGTLTTTLLAPGAANTVLVTNGAATAVTTALLVNANIDAAAAIDGSKINPAFGSQNVSTSGTLNVGATTATALTVSTFGTGVVHSSVAGVFSSSLIVNADITAGTLTVASLSPGSANTVFVTNGAATAVTTALLVNVNVDSAAAIAGTKISPDFGSQNITTTGTLTHADLQRGTVQTTNATPTTIITYSGLSANDTAVQIVITVTGLKNNFTEAAGYFLSGTFRRTGGTITQVGSTLMISQNEDTASWDATLSVSGTDILVQVTGVAATTINWRAVLEIVKNV